MLTAVTFVTWFTMLVLIAPAPPYTFSIITVRHPYLSKAVCEANTPAFVQVVEALEKDGITILDGEACVKTMGTGD